VSSLLIAWDFFGVINADAEMESILKSLQELGAVQIIVSHSSHYEIETYLTAHHLSPYIHTIYGADWHVGDKQLGKAPAIEHFLKESGQFDVKVMIGDGLSDIADGKTVGMKAILFDPKGYYQHTDHGADAVVASLGEVIELVQNSIDSK
jgi:phosphoglycolate phosphatase-like HAD superfamily hydrolase